MPLTVDLSATDKNTMLEWLPELEVGRGKTQRCAATAVGVDLPGKSNYLQIIF